MADVVSPRIYYRVFAILLACTVLTWWVSRLHLSSPLGGIVALTIAMGKALLVVLFFMHLKYSPKLTWAVALGSVFWLGILIALTMGDYVTRSWRTYG